jgi:hypothetical protein
LALVAGLLLPWGSARALVAAELLTPELQRQPIRLAGLAGGQLNYFDEDRRLVQRPAGQFVRLVLQPGPPDAVAAPVDGPPPMRIDLVDGQRFVGRWVGAARDGEAIVFEHARVGRLTLPLDSVRSLARDPGGGPGRRFVETTAGADRVTLANGDTVEGFVIAVDRETLTLLPDGAEQSIDLPTPQIASLTLANPLDPGGDGGDLVALLDGSRLRVDDLSIAGETATLTPRLADALVPIDLPLAELQRIDFGAAGLRLVNLVDRPRRVTAGGEAWGLNLPPRVDRAELLLHAPLTLEVELPDGAQRFAAGAELDLPPDLPADRRGWADLVLWIDPDLDDAEPSTDAPARRFHLTAGRPTARINLSLGDTQTVLTVRLDPAGNGPILDRLRLTEAVLLVEAPDPRPGSGD